MAQALPPPTVRLICGMLAARAGCFDEALKELTAIFGEADIISDVMDFDFTDYYDRDMGRPLLRRFVSFERLAPADALVAAKVAANAIEAGFASRAGGQPPRPINLDPGYVESSKLVLASMKNFSHRVYLGRGVYGEVTLQFRHGRWEAMPWTFPDYASGGYHPFLSQVRDRLRQQVPWGRGRPERNPPAAPAIADQAPGKKEGGP